ncbi:MAG: phosphate ABC transporter permease PstA [Telmatospirillum sp.]|nr:phosphate ABC transporter permease PstA [Telmatospirillum sp.]
MTDATADNSPAGPLNSSEYARRLKKRHDAEWRFRAYGLGAIFIGLAFLVTLLWTIVSEGAPAFLQSEIRLNVTFDKAEIDPTGTGNIEDIMKADYAVMVRQALREQLANVGNDRAARAAAHRLLSSGADLQAREIVLKDRTAIGQKREIWLIADGDVDSFLKGSISRDTPEDRRRISNQQIAWIEKLQAEGRLKSRFNTTIFTRGASANPEMAGVGVAALGSFMMLVITVLLALPIGVAAAIYLEEFAPKNRFTDLIEVNINNLAAVPSIVFGILGLAVFINFFGLPRSAPVVGGLVLTLMSLPTIIIATRAALKAVPPSIRDAALGLGASKMQAIFHHVLPLAMPGILTGTILALAHALGETAPLLMIGMVAFVVDYPGGPLDPATALPVQIYMWSNLPERGFIARTSAAIMILLGFLLVMNALAIWLRTKFERRW